MSTVIEHRITPAPPLVNTLAQQKRARRLPAITGARTRQGAEVARAYRASALQSLEHRLTEILGGIDRLADSCRLYGVPTDLTEQRSAIVAHFDQLTAACIAQTDALWWHEHRHGWSASSFEHTAELLGVAL